MPAAKPDGFAVTAMVEFVAPNVGATDSHAGTLVLPYPTVSVKLTPFVGLVTLMAWGAVAVVEPTEPVKLKLVGLTVSALAVEITRLTLTVIGVVLAPDGVTVTEPM